MIYIIFVHSCGDRCPSDNNHVTIVQDSIENTAYAMPDVRCIYTNDLLTPYSINGKLF